MKVKIIISVDDDYMKKHELYINGKLVYSIGSLSECPEDAVIGRDLIDATHIVKCMEMAYNAGKSGEIFEVKEVKELT